MKLVKGIGAFLLLSSSCFAQGTPAGVYRMPGQPETYAYEADPKETFVVDVQAKIPVTQEDGSIAEEFHSLRTYDVTGTQWYYLRKNIDTFCKQRKYMVWKVRWGGARRTVYLIPIPKQPIPDPVYPKGGVTQPK